jgi:hypothetical protein
MSRWYEASREMEGKIRREERNVDRCGDVVGLEDNGVRVSIMRSVSLSRSECDI